eukprot:TRINITY_DN3492_c0_g1_i1.p1 TRINITY_DN3492_c0_g1~~TRINITY_DN3492_c0_g1_i1.p1  ORF type:complete len:102 (+),score=17.18 TRINITY_DN3492_c0_g1_i1:59-364(+)
MAAKRAPISKTPAVGATSVGGSIGAGRIFAVGEKVSVNKVNGEVAYYGTTKFSAGVWVGIVLEQPVGKNDGTVMGQQYFSCAPNHGIFLKEDSSQIVRKVD